jgi:hypothetical protein
MLSETAELRIAENPDRLIMLVPNLSGAKARAAANAAVREARRVMPKLSGQSASRIFPLYGKGFFGIGFADSYVWFQENGIRPFTMYNLAGKTIPMWVNDPTGTERQRNPKAKTRVTMSGVTQVLIFRKVAQIGQTKTVKRRSRLTGTVTTVQTPASYPGAPGRIGRREAAQPYTTPGKTGGQIASGNVGVRWRHPGLAPRKFLNHSVTMAAQWQGILPIRIYVADRNWRARF